jgi:pimeloyl-ACP methyl ester carboxylesterase
MDSSVEPPLGSASGRRSYTTARRTTSAAPLASAHRLQREIPGAKLEVLEGTGHFVVEDAPERYA